jgi:hypothetical protein
MFTLPEAEIRRERGIYAPETRKGRQGADQGNRHCYGGLCLTAELLFRKMAAHKQTNKSATEDRYECYERDQTDNDEGHFRPTTRHYRRFIIECGQNGSKRPLAIGLLL